MWYDKVENRSICEVDGIKCTNLNVYFSFFPSFATNSRKKKVRTRVIASCINLVPFPLRRKKKKRPTRGGKQNNCFKKEKKRNQTIIAPITNDEKKKNFLCVLSPHGWRVVATIHREILYTILNFIVNGVWICVCIIIITKTHKLGRKINKATVWTGKKIIITPFLSQMGGKSFRPR